jgi:hypothetical protein
MKIITIFLLILLSFNIQAQSYENNKFMSSLLTLNLDKESKHLIITKFTENNNLSFFNHNNILFILENKKLNSFNKNKMIRLITLMDKLLEKRKQFYDLAKTFSTYHILYLNEMEDYDISTNKSIGEVFKMIQSIDSNLIKAIRELQSINSQEQ